MPARPFALSFRVVAANIGVLQTLSHDLARRRPAVAVERSEFGIDLYADTEQEMDWFIFHLRKAVPHELTVSAPEVQYREALTRSVVTDNSNESSTGERGAVASVKIAFAPGEREQDSLFRTKRNFAKTLWPALNVRLRRKKKLVFFTAFP
jgi:hypothetical protein